MLQEDWLREILILFSQILIKFIIWIENHVRRYLIHVTAYPFLGI